MQAKAKVPIDRGKTGRSGKPKSTKGPNKGALKDQSPSVLVEEVVNQHASNNAHSVQLKGKDIIRTHGPEHAKITECDSNSHAHSIKWLVLGG